MIYWYVKLKKRLDQKKFSNFRTLKKRSDKMPFAIIENQVDGGYSSGIYCDIDDTLILWKRKIVDKKIQLTPRLNQEVVDLLLKLEAEGKSITLWTGGDAEKTQEYIKTFDLPWKVVTKDSYRGRTVEIAIDDEGLDSYRIQVKKLYLYSKGE
jgi:hypothetical protein